MLEQHDVYMVRVNRANKFRLRKPSPRRPLMIFIYCLHDEANILRALACFKLFSK